MKSIVTILLLCVFYATPALSSAGNNFVDPSTIATFNCQFKGTVKSDVNGEIYKCGSTLRWEIINVSSPFRTITRTVAVTAYRWPAATVNCNAGETRISGGGYCIGGGGYNFIYVNIPMPNGWRIQCDTPLSHTYTAKAYVVCKLP